MSPTEFERRASALLGGHGWQAKWCAATGVSRQHMSKAVNGKAGIPLTWISILELLEVVDRERLPLRWQWEKAELRSDYPLSSPKVRRAIALAYGDICQYCGKPAAPPHVDHILAKANGGTDDLYNLTLACASCNFSKSAIELPSAKKHELLSAARKNLPTIHQHLYEVEHERRDGPSFDRNAYQREYMRARRAAERAKKDLT